MINDQATINDWYVIARAKDVSCGQLLPIKLLEQNLVLWRSKDALHVLEDRCPHRGTQLSLGSLNDDGNLTCPYHGWQFNTKGTCVKMPAHPDQTPPHLAQVASYRVEEHYGLIWATIGEPEQGVPVFPESKNPDYTFYFAGSYHFNSSPLRAFENALDLSHFPYVHSGILGDPSTPEMEDYRVELTDDGVLATDIKYWQPNPSNSSVGEATVVNYKYWVMRPLTGCLIKDVGDTRSDGKPAGETVYFSVQPISETSCVVWTLVTTNYDEQISANEVLDRTQVLAAQDLRIVESQIPKRLPLESGAEAHQGCDKTSVVYRRWLKQLGLTYGSTLYKSL